MSPLYLAATFAAFAYYLRRRELHIGTVYLWACLTTEHLYIHVLGGVLRPYHIGAVVLIPFLLREVDRAFATAVIRGLAVFLTINLIASLAVDSWRSALISYMLLVANALVAIALFGVIARYFDQERLATTILGIGCAAVILGLVQFAGSRLGLNTALAPAQLPFIANGEVASFWTEPDQLGKFLSMPFLLALVRLLHRRKGSGWAVAFLALGIMLNFVRSPLYGLAVALLALPVILTRRPVLRGRLAGAALSVVVVLSVFLGLVSVGTIPLGEYPLQRLEKVGDISYSSIASDGSGAYRIQSIQLLLQQVLSSPRTVFLGLGLNQASGSIGGNVVMLGGGDAINLFGGSGLLGLVSYLLLVAPLFYVPMRRIRSYPDDWFAQWLLVSAIAFVVTGQMSGMLIMPQFYLLIAANAYMEYGNAHPDALSVRGHGVSTAGYEGDCS